MHLTPLLLEEELKKIGRTDLKIFINHLKPFYEAEIRSELSAIPLLGSAEVLEDGYKIPY